MNEAAARAALEVVTRLRRSIYHHTARQGAMTIHPEAVDEAGGSVHAPGRGTCTRRSLYSLTHTIATPSSSRSCC